MSQNEKTSSGYGDVFAGGGKMGAFMRAYDWSKHPLGDPIHWPQSLKTGLRIILDSGYPMFIWWSEAFYMFHNDPYLPALGNKHPDALGARARDMWSEIWEQLGVIAERILHGGKQFYAEDLLILLERKGFLEETYWTFSYSPMPNDDGGIGGMFCACSEVTNKVLNQRRLKTLKNISDIMIQQLSSVEQVSQQMCNLLAQNSNDIPFGLMYWLDEEDQPVRLVGQTDNLPSSLALKTLDINNPADIAIWPLAQVLQNKQPAFIEDLPFRHDLLPVLGKATPTQAVIIPLLKPDKKHISGFLILGISPQLKYDADYENFHDLLVNQITTTLGQMQAREEERRRIEALVQIDKAKTVFFNNISHEFRTPLTLMLGPLEDLLAENLPKEIKEQLHLIYRNGERMLKLVNTLLEFARIEAGRVQAQFQAVALDQLTAELSGTFRSAIEKAGLALHLDCPPLPERVYVDVSMWERIIFNLLSNALKFTFQGHIAVDLTIMEKNAILTVADTGVGIPAEALPHLFERFHRVEGTKSRTHEGSGIGLALVYQLVKLHGGAINVDSSLGQGSTFTISIPLGHQHLPAEQLAETTQNKKQGAANAYIADTYLDWLQNQPMDHSSKSSPAPATKTESTPRLLVVDDNADMRNYLARFLVQEYEVMMASNGKEAWEKVQDSLPDLVISDVMMPIMDGVELVGKLRSDERTQTIPIILLSARAGEDAQIEGLEAGADDYLTKPFAARELKARINTHLKLAWLNQKLALQGQQARQEAERQQAKLLDMFEQAPVAIAILHGPDYVVELVNPVGSRLWGIKPEEAIGKPLFKLLPEASGQGFEELLNGVLRTGEPFVGQELPITLNQGDRSVTEYFNFVYQPWRDEQGQVTGVIAVATGVSEQVAARQEIEVKNKELLVMNTELDRALQEEYKLTALLDNSSDFIGLATPEGKAVYINPAGRALVGLEQSYPVAELKIVDLFFEEDLPFVQKTIFPTALEKGNWVGEYRARHVRTGQAIPVLYNCFTVKDPNTDELLGFATISIDITERKKKEAELRQYREQLALTNQELATANKELTVANEELLDSNKELGEINERLNRVNADLDNFVYMASHDLKAPIANIEGLLEVLKSNLSPASSQSAMVQQIMDLMNNSIERFKNTLIDLAQITRLQREVVEDIEELSIKEVLNQVQLDLAPMIEEAEAQLDIDVSDCPPIQFSAKNMRSIFYNLLSNAVKYRSSKRLLVVRIRCEETSEYQILTVTDNGLGIDMAEEHKIFAMFKRLHGHVEGTGLGLYIIKKIIENAGGKIKVESQVDVGSTFTVFFKR